MWNSFAPLCFAIVLLHAESNKAAEPHPLSDEDREALARRLDAEIDRTSRAIEKTSDGLQGYSRRGDALFFRGRFDDAVADYNRMVELDPNLADSHWRRGIALYYAGRYQEAAGQFERYHTYDNVDRENGIWRFFSQFKAYGKQQAQRNLLKYKQDDREPFGSVYRLFQGDMTPQQIITQVEGADVDDEAREKRRFYADLYIGLNYAVADESDAALPYLRKAVANAWPRTAGYGPNYMWHVGRVHYELLSQRKPHE